MKNPFLINKASESIQRYKRGFRDLCTNIIYFVQISEWYMSIFILHNIPLLSLHPLCGGGDLLFLLSPPAAAAAATCFCSHSETPTRIISKYLQYAYWPWIICLVFFFFAFFSFFNKIQDGRQNPMAHTRARTASSICFMFGLNERPYSGRELKSFWCDSNNKNFFNVLVF